MNSSNLDFRRYGTPAFLIASVIVVGVFLYFSNSIVTDLATQERARMQIWADATKEIVNLSSSDNVAASTDIDFLLGIIEANNNIPVLLTDGDNNIIQQRNFNLPDPDSPDGILAPDNNTFLTAKLEQLRKGDNVIDIDIAPGVRQRLYYEDSTLLKRLSLYPYIQLVVMAAFILVVYLAVTSSKRAEQNKVWVGLSKETAHQLASRFSKIGSQPQIEIADINRTIARASSYMRSRISSRISLEIDESAESLPVSMSEPLIEWVMENLIKNAVDAMEGKGSIRITVNREGGSAVVRVTDSGKGMTRKMRKEVFRPGFTTKKRGWGLGLTLARRIIEQYHRGRIFVSASEPGIGTTFEIQLPLTQTPTT